MGKNSGIGNRVCRSLGAITSTKPLSEGTEMSTVEKGKICCLFTVTFWGEVDFHI